jgi:outer membrane protein assembly factor BamB
MVDKDNRTWIAQATGGIIFIDGDGELSPRSFFRTRRRFDCAGVIRDDHLYIGGEDHFVYAVNLSGKRGQNDWRDSPDAGRTGGAVNCPLTISANDELLVVSQDGLLHAFDWDGKTKWTVPLPGQVFGSPVVDPDGTILVGISQTPRHQPAGGILVAIDGATRQIRWRFTVAAPIESTPVIGDDGTIYFGDNAGIVYALKGPSELAWQATFDAQVRSGGTILAPNVVAFGLDDGSLVALKCSSKCVVEQGWPKFQRTIGQSGLFDD